MPPVKRSIFAETVFRRISFTLPSVPAASSALKVSIWRLRRRPPRALISSAARICPLYEGSPSTAAAPVKKVMWPILYGVSGMLPLGWASARPTRDGLPTSGTPAEAAAPTVTPRELRKSRRDTSGAIRRPSFVGWTVSKQVVGQGDFSRGSREDQGGSTGNGLLRRDASQYRVSGRERL